MGNIKWRQDNRGNYNVYGSWNGHRRYDIKEEVEIGENETTGELWTRLAKIGGKLLVETVDLIEKGEAPREKQNDKFSMAPMLKKEMAQIDWENKTAREIKNLVRGLNPIMGAYSTINGKK